MKRIKMWLCLLMLVTGVFMCSDKAQASVGKLDYDTVKLKTKICTTQSREYSLEWEEEMGGYLACWHGAWEGVTELIHFVDAEDNYTLAYADEKYVYIDTISTTGAISHKLSITKKYPLLGDVICDRENNYYIVWGQGDEKGAGNCVTVSIAKYNEKGEYLGSCDVRTSPEDNKWETRFPFDSCDTVIADGVLTTMIGREMYSGHQSNTTVSVDIESMELVGQDACYVSHCFATRVTGLKSGEVMYGNLGDAYPRGFMFQWGGKRVLPFHFYGELGDNDTYSQLGDMVEFGDNVFYCATSTKSMKEDCAKQSQNLFIQGINFEFEGGTSRTGTSIGEKYTDTGIIWLTNYTKKHAKNPQIVKINDSQALVMWEVFDAKQDDYYLDTYYMIISDKGEIIQGARSLNGQRLNTYEQPLLWNNAICWVSSGYADPYMRLSSKDAIVYRLSLEQDNTKVKKGTKFLIGNAIYKVTGKKTVTLNGFRDKLLVYDMEIPATVKYKGKTYKITEIGKGAFENCTKLTRVTGGRNVTKIGDNAFAKCKKLQWVITDKKLTTIGKKAFYNCKKIQAVTFTTKKLKKVGKKAFTGIPKYATIYVPAGKTVKYRKLLQKAGLKKGIRIRQDI